VIVCLSGQFTDNFTINPAFLRDSPDCANHIVNAAICDGFVAFFFVNMNRRMLLDSIYDWRLMQVGMVSAWSSWRLANTNPNYANLLPVLDTMIGPAVIYEFDA